MIEVEHLTKRYGALTAIHDVTFQMKRGEIVGFLGVNGAGKTTTMRILTGYLPPTDGHATIAGYDVFRQSLAARRHIGYLPETVPLYTEMTVYDYLDYMGRLRGLRHNRQARIDQVMDMVDVGGLAYRIIGTLSKGQRQRVGLAQAIVHNPDVLILDEPTIGLDPRQIREVRSLVRQLGEAHTILLSTHILPEVSQVCDRVLIVNGGRVQADMSISEATRGGLPDRVIVRVGGDAPAAEVPAVLAAVPHVASVAPTPDGAYEVVRAQDGPAIDLRPLLAQAVVSRSWALLELRGAGVALEDLFLSVTREEITGAAPDGRENGRPRATDANDESDEDEEDVEDEDEAEDAYADDDEDEDEL